MTSRHPIYLPKPRLVGRSVLVFPSMVLNQRLAVLMPPPGAHRHRYRGVLAPNAKLRAAVTALAPAASDYTPGAKWRSGRSGLVAAPGVPDSPN